MAKFVSTGSLVARSLIASIGIVLATSGCIADSELDDRSATAGSTEPDGSQIVSIANVAAMTQLANGDVVMGDRTTGEIWRMSLSELQPRLITTVEVTSDGQRGLLGLVAAGPADQETLYVSWTNADLDLAVGGLSLVDLESSDAKSGAAIVGLQPTLVWSGFESATGANGGHLAVLPDGRLVLGVGTLRNSSAINDPDKVNGKMLALQTAAGSDQRPEVLSDGWRNPFAFAVAETGEIWVADNEPEDGTAERIGRGDVTAPLAMINVEAQLAPGALIVIDSDRLGLCSFLTGEMYEVVISDSRPTQPGTVIASGCRTGGLLLADGRLLLSDNEVVRLKPFEPS